jgi:hypothetical protein
VSDVLLEPNDPRVLERVLHRIETMTPEEWLERMQQYPDFDPSWLEPPAASPARMGLRLISVRRKGTCSRVLARNGARVVPASE